MNYEIISDRIEVRSLGDSTAPRYIVKGTAVVSNKKHTFDWQKGQNGDIKLKKNTFTDHFVQSMKEQIKNKKVFVDTQHELVRDSSIKALVKDKLNVDQMGQLNNMLKRKMLPISKVNDVEIESVVENGVNLLKMNIETELNPSLRIMDEDHKNYFDAVWYSLENKFLTGMSINMGDFKMAQDAQGDWVVDDAEILGISYVDGQAGTDHSIYEVAIRAIGDGGNGVNMENEKAQLETERAKLAEDRKALEAEKQSMAQAKADALRQSDLDKQKSEQSKLQAELDKKTEEAKRLFEENARLNSSKGVVSQRGNPNAPGANSPAPAIFAEKLKEITAEHDATMATFRAGKMPMIDKTMNNFSELVNLQAKAGDLTADLNQKNAEFIRENRLLDRAPSDLVVPKLANA